ncbi:MAG: hypothetical protein AB1635_10705 [Acidobacteriota bacterium]
MRFVGINLVVLLATAPAGAQAPSAGPYTHATVVPAFVACTDVPLHAAPTPTLHIQAAHAPDGRSLYGPGESVVLSGDLSTLEPGQRFFVRRAHANLDRRPISRQAPGALRTAGWLTVTAVDAAHALARIDYACDSIEEGDFLEPLALPVLPQPIEGGQPHYDDMAAVMFGVDRREAFGGGDLLNIDRGQDAGLAPGMRVIFVRDRKNGTPLVELGDGVVLDVAAATARVVVSRARDAIYAGDLVAVRR